MSFISPNLLLNVAGIAMSQKNIAFYLNYEEGNEFLSELGIDTTQLLMGAASSNKEVLNGIYMISEPSILDARIEENSNLMTNPIETGELLTDHKVILPVEMSVRLAMPTYGFKSLIKEMNGYWRNSTALIVLTKARAYRNMLIDRIHHVEEMRTIDRMVFDVHLKEAILVKSRDAFNVDEVSNPSDSDTKAL